MYQTVSLSQRSVSLGPQDKCEPDTVVPFLVLSGPGLLRGFFQNLAADHVIAPGFNESTHESMIFIICRTRGVGSSDESWPSKARRPVLNLGPLYELGFFASFVL